VKALGLAIVIPTRNRSDLVKTALASVLAVHASRLSAVIVSDNSTRSEDSRELGRLVESLGDARLVLLKPPKPLAMTAHWEWVMNRALAMPDITHVAYLTDRMFLRPRWFLEACDLSARYPDDIVSYADDMIQDDRRPIAYAPSVRSGKAFRIESASLLEQSARMAFFTCLPRMLNCIVPRPHLEALKSRYGEYFSSVSPDFCFCYRSLSAVSSLVYLDKSVMVSHGHDRSNGHSAVKGRRTETSEDFIAQLPVTQKLFEGVPLPDVHTVGNAIASEYLKVRMEQGGSMPPLSIDAYLECLAAETMKFEDRELARATRQRLARAGWRPGLEFRFRAIRTWLMTHAHSILERRFQDPTIALGAAAKEPRTTLPWLHGAVRPYRAEEIQSPGIRSAVDGSEHVG